MAIEVKELLLSGRAHSSLMTSSKKSGKGETVFILAGLLNPLLSKLAETDDFGFSGILVGR